MKAAIQKRLKQTPGEYDNMILSMWLKWCGEKTDNRQSLQRAMCNQMLFNWWRAQIKKYERQFLEETAPYQDSMSAPVARVYYADTIIPVFNFFARPLMPKKSKSKPLKKKI